MRLANAPVSWGVSEATGGSQPLAATVLDEIAACGYAGTELGPYGFLPTEPAALRAALAARGLALVGAFCPLTLHDRASREAALVEAERIIALLAAAGATVLVLAEAGDAARRAIAGRVPHDGGGGFDDAQWARFAEGADTVARLASARGLTTAFHPHAATYIETEAEIDELMRRTDPDLVGLCLDTGHLVYGGGDPAAVAERHASRVRHVHLKDVRSEVLADVRSGRLDFPAAVAGGVFAPLGAGSVALGAVLDTLVAHRYAGWLVVEQDRVNSAGGDQDLPRADASRSRQYLRARE